SALRTRRRRPCPPHGDEPWRSRRSCDDPDLLRGHAARHARALSPRAFLPQRGSQARRTHGETGSLAPFELTRVAFRKPGMGRPRPMALERRRFFGVCLALVASSCAPPPCPTAPGAGGAVAGAASPAPVTKPLEFKHTSKELMAKLR